MFYSSHVTNAAKKQLDHLWHTTNIYYHPTIHEYAELMASKLPGNLKVQIIFYKNGSTLFMYSILVRNLGNQFSQIRYKQEKVKVLKYETINSISFQTEVKFSLKIVSLPRPAFSQICKVQQLTCFKKHHSYETLLLRCSSCNPEPVCRVWQNLARSHVIFSTYTARNTT